MPEIQIEKQNNRKTIYHLHVRSYFIKYMWKKNDYLSKIKNNIFCFFYSFTKPDFLIFLEVNTKIF